MSLERAAARLILFSPQHRVLLFQIQLERLDGRISGPFWVTPGGGLEPGESYEDAARRELFEETRISDAIVGPCVAIAEYELVERDRATSARERFYVAHCNTETIDLAGLMSGEVSVLRGHRWWDIDELQHTQERIVPNALPRLIVTLRTGYPEQPIDLTE